MKRIIFTFFVLVLFKSLFLQPVMARDFESGYAVYGAGSDNCQAYLNSMKQGSKQRDYFIDWTIGYLSAFNVIMPNTYNILGESEFADAQGWLQRDCGRYPKQLYIDAVIKLTGVLYPLRYQSGMKTLPPVPKPSLKDVGKAVK